MAETDSKNPTLDIRAKKKEKNKAEQKEDVDSIFINIATHMHQI